MANSQVDLAHVFGAALHELTAERAALNAADTGNHDHGDNMVQIFKTITHTVAQDRGAAPSEALAHAAEALATRSTSGSGQLYAQNLGQAAEAFQGQALTPENAVQLINLILGGGSTGVAPQQSAPAEVPPPAAGSAADASGGQGGIDIGDLLNMGAQILAGASGNAPGSEAPASTPPSTPSGAAQGGGQGGGQAAGGIDIGELINLGEQVLAGRGGGQNQATAPAGGAGSGGLDIGQLFNMWRAYSGAKQRGGSDMEAIVSAILGRSSVAQSSPYRVQSSRIVAESILKAVLAGAH